mmetsp:Transcript_42160/g.75471  ORF Transcript_42160/g.75471 Transcript_42160/m.75471 type:complete len:80 (-) Transcript_42160:941-1180(-)
MCDGVRSKTGHALGASCLLGPDAMSMMVTSGNFCGFAIGAEVRMGGRFADLAAVAVHLHTALPSTAEDAKTDTARRGTA